MHKMKGIVSHYMLAPYSTQCNVSGYLLKRVSYDCLQYHSATTHYEMQQQQYQHVILIVTDVVWCNMLIKVMNK